MTKLLSSASKPSSLQRHCLPLIVTLSLLTLGTHAAQAQVNYTGTATTPDSDKLGLKVGINAIITGSPYDVDNTVNVLPGLFYDNGKVYARGSQLGGYVLNDQTHELTAYFQPSGFEFDPDEAKDNQKGLNERDWSGMVGVSYMRRTPIGAFRGRVSTDVLGNSEGTQAQLTYLTRLQTGNWTIYPSLGLEWSNSDYNDYYYGVSVAESSSTGVVAYEADASINPYVSVSANYDINDDWSVFLNQNIAHLSDEQADSPMVDDKTTYRTSIGIFYEF